MPRSLYMRYYYLLCGAFILVDQITKLLVRMYMEVGQSISLIGDFFCLTYVRNTGAAFSMLSGERLLLVAIPAIVITAAVWYFHKHPDTHWMFRISWTLILAGGIGNLIDRIAIGWVTDMLDFSIFPPVFNIADIGVTCGCFLFIFYTLFEERLKKSDEKRDERTEI